MKFSIIIPVHNAEKTIRNCVEVIVSQTMSQFEVEIILVENGSSDASLEICMQLRECYSNIYVYRSNISDPSIARNIGLEHVNGDIIGFCDADDCYEESVLKRAYDVFVKDEQIKMIVGTMQLIKGDRFDVFRSKNLSTSIVENSKEFADRIICDARIMGSVCNKFYRSEIVKNVRFKEKLFYCEDTLFNIEVLSKNESFKIQTLKDVAYKYIKTGESATKDVSKLFDISGELRYIVTMNQIGEMFSTELVDPKSLKRAKYVMAVDNYGTISEDDKRKEKLYIHIAEGYKIHLFSLFKYTVVRNVKFAIKGTLILLHGR